VPDAIAERECVLVRSDGIPKWLVFNCPCRTRHTVFLNLDTTRHPAWRLLSESPLTLWPSIDVRAADRHCHYIMYRGRVEWIWSETYWRLRHAFLRRS